MPTPRVSRSAGATPSGGAGAGRGGTRSPPARRVSPRDRRADKARSPAHARSPLAEIFGSPEAGAARRGSSLGGAADDKARRARAPSPEEDDADEAEAIMATQAAPASEAVGGDEPRVGRDVFVGRPSGAPEETTPSATPLAPPVAGASAETATEAATRCLSERVFRDTGKRLGPSWTARYDQNDSPSGGSAGKRRRLWYVSPGGKKFDGPGKVIAFVGTARATEGSDFVRGAEVLRANEKKRDANDDGPGPAPPPNAERDAKAAGAPPGASRESAKVSRKSPAGSLAKVSRADVSEKRSREPSPRADGGGGEERKGAPTIPRPTPTEDSRPGEEATRERPRVGAGPRSSEPSPSQHAPLLGWRDARAGDAAARVIRARLLSSNSRRSDALAFRPELREHRAHLVDILGDTVRGAQNNSVLLVGGRGSGKTAVLDSALRELRETHGSEKVLVVKLNGMLHGDEKVGVREIARQLCAAGDALEFSRAAGFGENVAFMREVLRVLEQGGRAVVFVLEEFDLFAKGGAKSKQTLLYAVLDLLQQAHVQAAVVGVTSRHDAAEMLEKRVRSRFSFRRILLAPPVADVQASAMFRDALRLEETCVGDARTTNARTSPKRVLNEEEEGPKGVSARPGVAAENFNFGSYAKTFNAALDAAIATPAAREALAKVEALECTPRAVGDLACLVISRMDRDVGLVTARDIAAATQTLLADTYVKSLAGASTLELCLVVAMSRLHRFRRMPRFNFNHVENEMRAMAANDFLGDAGRAKGAVLLRAFENLLTAGACEAPGGGAGGALGGAGGARARGAAGAHKLFRGIQLLVTDEEVEEAVEMHATKPAGLKELLTHEGVRAATGF